MKQFKTSYLFVSIAAMTVQIHAAYTDYKWEGTVDTDFTNSANWNGGLAAPFGGTNALTRISVYNGANSPIYYTAAQGHSLYQNAEHRCLFIGSGGSMYITGGTFESQPNMENGLSNNSDGTLVIDGGTYLQSGGSTTFLVKYGGTGTGTLTVSNGLFQAGEVRFGAGNYNGSGVINFDGGTTRVSRFYMNASVVSGTATVNFNGGLLQARTHEPYFLRNLSEANVLEGGVLIDTAGYDITIDQDLLDGGGSGGFTKQGIGRLALGGTSTFAGDVVIENGQVRVTNASALGTTNGITTVSDGASLEIVGNVTVTNETIIINGKPSSNWGALTGVLGESTWGGNILIGSDNSRITAYNDSILRISGVIDDGSSSFDVQFRSFGTGIVVVSEKNTYGGDTEVVTGLLRLDEGNNRLPIGTRLLIGNGSNVDYATFDLNGYDQEVAILDDSGTTMENSVIDSAGGGTLTVNDSGNRTFAGNFVGPLTLVKTNSNVLTLDGDMQSTTIKVNQGTLQGSATWHCLFNDNDTPNQMIVTDGTLDISSMTFDYDENSKTKAGTYVIVDYSAGGTLTANATAPFFADTEDMPELGKITHNSVTKQVLFTYGEQGTVILIN